MIFKKLREEEKQLTQQEIAEDLGTKRSTVACWEIGKNQPNKEMLCKIANYFNKSPNYLLNYEEKKEELSKQEKELLTKFRKLKP